jgi:two-component system phosphate regulon sensor histidine kinase PhoR
MKVDMNPTKRIALILVAIFLLPALFFSVYEISSLNKDERVIEDIYKKQLEAILFSVNQYSDDALSRWISKIEIGIDRQSDSDLSSPIQSLLSLNSSIHSAFLVDSADQKMRTRIFSLFPSTTDSLRLEIDERLRQSATQIQQLIKYKKSGFQKTEVSKYKGRGSGNFELIFFIVESTRGLRVAGLLINPNAFIEDMVGPKLQMIAKDQFILSAFDKSSSSLVYSTMQNDTASLRSSSLSKDFWIFPDYALGIRTQGASLKQIVRDRTNTNLILLVVLDVILIIALVLAFRNVKKEVQLAQNKADFVSNVSHEIRTPLALISMFAETLEMGRLKSEEKKQEYYAIISKETHRLAGIVNKILNFSQTEAGKKTLHIESVNLAAEIQQVLKTYDFHLRNKGFEYHVEDKPDLFVMADKEALIEMIINLIDNAIKYSSTTKRIEIKQGTEGEFGWIAIKDFGIGISKADQKHVFDKFYRVSSGNLAKSQGTGLGLSLVKQLIEQQNGKISVTSDLGGGSTFTLFFPLL